MAAFATEPEMPNRIVAARVTHALSWLTQNAQVPVNRAQIQNKLSQNGGQFFGFFHRNGPTRKSAAGMQHALVIETQIEATSGLNGAQR